MSRSTAAALLCGLLALSITPGAQAQGTLTFAASGRLLDATGAPVPCCDVDVQVRTADGSILSRDVARTRGDGSFRADGLVCDPSLDLQVVAVPRCCTGESEPRDITGCVDPNTGGPLEELDLGDVFCDGAPATNRTLLTGRTVCRDGVFLEPVADCAIHLRPIDLGLPGGFTWTEADGSWELCADCNSAFPPPERIVEAQCCGVEEVVSFPDCPERQVVPNFVCDPCPEPPCDEPRDIEVRGRVLCPDPGGGPGEPVPDCRVQVTGFTDCMEQFGPFEAITEADGTWTLCMPCPLGEDCTVSSGWQIQALPDCCPNGQVSETILGCPPVVQLPDNRCPLDPLGGCALEGGCATGETRVSGTVTCRDPAGNSAPVPDCPIMISCPGGVPVETVTGPDGSYSACVPCAGCDFAVVSALCCAAQTTVDLLGCPGQATADLTCTACPPPPRPCPPPDAVRVTGLVACSQGDGSITPLAGCAVTLAPVSATGMPLDPIVTTTTGDGAYADCVPCGPDGLSELTVSAECCGVETTIPVDGCPETLAIDPLLCDRCSPCPDGMTRLQGRVHCRGTGPVAGCRVRINLPTCDGDEIYFATTDEQGRYRLCLPCPCPGEVVRVTSECCDGTTVRVIDDCGPITPMRTIFCGSGCP